MNFKRFHESKNLFDKDNTTIYNAYFNTAGYWLLSSDSKSVKIPCQPNTEYTLSVPNSLAVFRIFEGDNANIEPTSTETASSKTTTITRNENISQYTFTTSSTAQIILFQGSNSVVTEWFNGLMLNTGSTPLPYEPYGNSWHDIPYYIHKTATDTLSLPAVIYPNDTSITVGVKGNTVQNGTPTPQTPVDVVGVGELETSGEHSGQYKIPISSASTTTPVYLGEVQTTRKIKKYEFTGEEGWSVRAELQGASSYQLQLEVLGVTYSIAECICSHYKFLASYGDISDHIYQYISNANFFISITDTTSLTLNDFKTYLAQQYSNGTPVTVWYVLANETTGIVNEPLRKIGDYADEVSGITIPTIAGADSFDVLTTLKPSEVSLAYTGWHDASVKEWDGSQWQ